MCLAAGFGAFEVRAFGFRYGASGFVSSGSSIRLLSGILFRRTPHPVTVTVRANKDYMRVLFYSYYTTITRWGVLLRHTVVYFFCFWAPQLTEHLVK